jgi:hypothetical protein
LARSYPSKIVGRWRQQVKPDLFRVYFFDDLKRDPVNLRTSIVTFLGGDPQKPSGALPPDHNAKAEKQKLSLTKSGRVHLAKLFREELYKCAVELGGPATDWPRLYGL